VRTTLTLDPDVAARLDRVRRRRGVPLKRVVNDALREGLSRLEDPAPAAAFTTRTVSLGRSRLGSLDDVAEALELAEGAPLA
jgi:hypothetical protein